uniref:PDZ domain-containing protein n=1 Tax=Eptatretus burgeri TaxID=7764 RepID=A0A8C4QXE2_EPTBU
MYSCLSERNYSPPAEYRREMFHLCCVAFLDCWHVVVFFSRNVANVMSCDYLTELCGIFVKSITPGSAAANDGRIGIGDRIIAVDGQDLQGYSNQQAVEELRHTGKWVHLSLARRHGPAPHGQPVELHNHSLTHFTLSEETDYEREQGSDGELVDEISNDSKLEEFIGGEEEVIRAKWTESLGSEHEILVSRFDKSNEQESLGITLEPRDEQHVIRSLLPADQACSSGSVKPGDDLLEMWPCSEEEYIPSESILHLDDVKLADVSEEVEEENAAVPVSDTNGSNHDKENGRYLALEQGHWENETVVDEETHSTCISESHLERHPVWESEVQWVELEKGSHGLGFSVLDYQDPQDPEKPLIVIRSLVPGGAADNNGQLLPGDRLLYVNQQHLSHAGLDEAVAALKGAALGPVRIGVLKPLPEPSARISKVPLDYEKNIKIQKGTSGLGLTVTSVASGVGVIVRSVAPGGAVANDNHISPGDYIVRINGEVLGGVGNARARALLRKHSLVSSELGFVYPDTEACEPSFCELTYVLAEEVEDYIASLGHVHVDLSSGHDLPEREAGEGEENLSSLPNQWEAPRRVFVNREDGCSLGISIMGGRRMGARVGTGEVMRGIFIKHILPDSPAGRAGVLREGDRILEVGGVELAGGSHEEVVEAIRQAANPVEFFLQSLVGQQQAGAACTKPQPPQAINLRRSNPFYQLLLKGGVESYACPLQRSPSNPFLNEQDLETNVIEELPVVPCISKFQNYQGLLLEREGGTCMEAMQESFWGGNQQEDEGIVSLNSNCRGEGVSQKMVSEVVSKEMNKEDVTFGGTSSAPISPVDVVIGHVPDTIAIPGADLFVFQ